MELWLLQTLLLVVGARNNGFNHMRIFTDTQLERLPTKQLWEVLSMAQNENRIWEQSKEQYDEDDCFPSDDFMPWTDYITTIQKILAQRREAKANK